MGFIRIHVLHHAAEQPVYGLSLIEELRRHGYALSPGTLYPILHGLAEAGYLRLEKRVVGGRVRKYYTSTARGRRALTAARTQIKELVGEVLEHSPQPSSPPLPSRPASRGVRGRRYRRGATRR
ncbi:MAG: PadR family transcriptional regulator [candidate division NC10 bacterium]